MTVRVGINGFGRTGRALWRAIRSRDGDVELVAVNDRAPVDRLARLLARDSVHGPLGVDIKLDGGTLQVGDRTYHFLNQPDPAQIGWATLGVDVVVESSGRFTSRELAAGHLAAGASRVIVSAPCKDADATFVVGVNDSSFDPDRHAVVSNASCTTNCLVPMVKVLDDAFGVERGFMTTVHAYTGDQMLVDGPHKDARRARAAGVNIVPTSTGAARSTGMVMQAMRGRLDGIAVRVPVPDGSLTDLIAIVSKEVSQRDVNQAFGEASASGPLASVLEYSEEPLVSTDVLGSPASCIFDSSLTMASARLVKVLGWYDNEVGYAHRLLDLAHLIGSTH